MPNEALSLKLREVLAEKMGLDANSASNDEAAVKALDEAVKAAMGVVEQRGEALDENAAVEVLSKVDIGALADAINARTSELKAKTPPPEEDRSQSKIIRDQQEAARAAGDVMTRAKHAGGIFQLVTGGAPSLKYLIAHKSADENVQMLQRANDEFVTLSAAMGIGTKDAGINSVRDLACYQGFMETMAGAAKAMNTTDDAAWTPTVYSDMFVENVYQTTDVARLFPRFPWPGTGGTATVPAEGDDINIYSAGEATSDDDASKFTAATPGVGTSITVTAKVLTSRVVVSWEMIEDSIVPIIDHIMTKTRRAHAFDLDDAIISGDTSASHQDTGYTMVANDRRKVFSGLRYKALNDATTLTSCATYANFEQFMTPILLMGAYGQTNSSSEVRATDTVFICSHPTKTKMGWLRDTRNNNLFLVGNFPGAPFAAVTGQFDQFGGFQRVASSKMPNNLNASGIYDGSTTTKSSALWVYLPAWHIYEKRDLTMGMVDRLEEGQRVMVGHRRLAFQHMYASTEHTTSALYGFASQTANWPA